MFDRLSLPKLVIGLVISLSMWQIYLMEQSMITPKHGFLNLNQLPAQYHYQQQQQLNSITKYNNTVSTLHRSTQPNDPNGNLTTQPNSMNTSNYLKNSNYNLSLTEDLSKESILNDVQDIDFITNQTNENITTHKNLIDNTNYLTNSSYNLSLVNYPYTDVNYEALPKDDIGKLIDLHNFEYIINQKSCREASLSSSSSQSPRNINKVSPSSSQLNINIEIDTNNSYSKQNIDPGSPLVLIYVTSAPGNYQKRLLIRETWGSPASAMNNIRLLFLLAAVNETKDQESLENENRIYSDIIQGNFDDNYKNLSYKHVMAFKWFTYYCPNAKYILKIDDDVFINTPQLVNYLNTVADRHDLLFCRTKYGTAVERGDSKWSVSRKEYYADYYPTYCPGFSVLYSPDVAFRLYLEAQKSPYFWIEDIYVTGILRQQANITITTSLEFELYTDALENILNGETDINANPFLIVWPDIMEDEIRKLWKLVESS